MKLRLAAIFFLASLISPASLLASGQLEIRVVDRDTGQPLAVRMHLKNAKGTPVKPPGVPSLGDHFVIDGKIILHLPNGGYEFLVERGPEYLERNGHFQIDNFADDNKTIDMKRFVDMAKEGWYSGDLDVDRPQKEIELLMHADDLHVVPLITWSNKKNPWLKQPLPKVPITQFDGTFFYSLLGGELTSPGNTLRVFGLDKPLDVSDDSQSKTAASASAVCPGCRSSKKPIASKAPGSMPAHFSPVICQFGSPPVRSIPFSLAIATWSAKASSITKPAAGLAIHLHFLNRKATAAGRRKSITTS